MNEQLDLGLALLDHQIIDCDGRRCGNVDDLAIEGGPGERPVVTAILVGPGAWRAHGRLGRLAARLGGGGRIRVPWDEVADVGAHVQLKKKAGDYRLGRGDDRARRWVARLPGADR
jgi:sporulation protein YlmC with PRC-barrel domain